MRATLFLVFLSLICLTIAIKAPETTFRKQLQGPPSEFASLAIPAPEKAALRADSSLIPFTLTQTSNGDWTWSSVYPVDTPDRITVSILSPSIDSLNFYLQPPHQAGFTQIVDSMFDGTDTLGKKSHGGFGIDGNELPAYSYTFFNPMIGDWNVVINSTSAPLKVTNAVAKTGITGYLILDNLSPLKLVSHLNTYELDQGKDIGVVIRMIQENDDEDLTVTSSILPAAVPGIISSATMNVLLPSGSEVSVPMHDDGLHFDLEANDGVYGATIPATTTGNYVFQSVIEGVTPVESHKFLRSTSHLVSVTPPEMTLTGDASAAYSPVASTVSFNIGVNVSPSATESADTVRAYAEVWGLASNTDTSYLVANDEGASYVPIAWVQSMVDPVAHPILGKALVLTLDENWVKAAHALPPFQLRNVVVQDRNTFGILTYINTINVQNSPNGNLHGSLPSIAMLERKLHKLYSDPLTKASLTGMQITEQMRNGPRPASFKTSSSYNVTAANGKLLLVHGYCSGDVWPSSDFTNSAKFEDYSQSRSQDQFALLIRAFGEQYGAYSIVGHSQGGLAALHLKAYYWSGLDLVGSGKPIQTVGSPYAGCSLAGSLANIGSLFGVGCASNADLATDGASLWLSKVPQEPQHAVSYYRTTYTESWFLFTSCVTASGLVLYSPNDGTCEIKFSTLPLGGTNMGTTTGWCHTSNMNYPPQCTDKSRNAQINAAAAR